MKLLKHLISFVVSFTAFCAAAAAVLLVLDDRKRRRYVRIGMDQDA